MDSERKMQPNANKQCQLDPMKSHRLIDSIAIFIQKRERENEEELKQQQQNVNINFY